VRIVKKVFFEILPKWEYGRYKGKINWTKSIGHVVDFVYNDLKGKIEIIDYKKNKNMLTVKYLDSEFNIHTNGFRKCSLGELLKVKTVDHKYTVGSIINNMMLLEQIRMNRKKHTEKGYEYQCLKCGYIGKMYETQITANIGCQACANRIIVKGLNDIATTNPEYLKYFVDINDAYEYSRSANKEIKVKCPECGYMKTMTINALTNTGFSCNKCSDGIPYPEKFMMNVLDQLNIQYEIQKVFDWSKKIYHLKPKFKKLSGMKKYDFYIPKLNMIIETHGEQHYRTNFDKLGGRNIDEEIENDDLKMYLAYNNGIKHYIILDCRKSELEWIKNSIMNSKLNELFDLSKINWLKCHEYACNTNLIKTACKLWNKGLGAADISKILKIGHSTVIKYLHKGTELNLCNYINVNEPKIIVVYDLNQKELGIFNSINQLSRESEQYFGVKFSSGNISQVCQGKAKTHKGFKFAYKNK
jgi:DNA-directed RNA polymerase subunit RPC12/RpoP